MKGLNLSLAKQKEKLYDCNFVNMFRKMLEVYGLTVCKRNRFFIREI